MQPPRGGSPKIDCISKFLPYLRYKTAQYCSRKQGTPKKFETESIVHYSLHIQKDSTLNSKSNSKK